MARRTILRQRAWGEAILDRLDDTYVPPELTKHVRAFKAAQAGLVSATRRATAERERRDAALLAVGRADGALERAVLGLGKKLRAVGLGEPNNPFAGRSSQSPAKLVLLEPPRAARETARVLAKLRGVKAPSAVKKAMAACAEASRAVEAACARVETAQKSYARALDARDALLHKWTTALARLRRRADQVWSESPDVLALIFAPLGEDEVAAVLDLKPVLPTVMNGVHTS